MTSTAVLQEVLNHVDHAAFALSGELTPHERTVALAELEEVHELLSTLANAARVGDQLVVPQRRAVSCPGPALTPQRAPRLQRDDGPADVLRALLDQDVRAVRTARTLGTRACEAWELPTAAASTVVDLASELVSNAVLHARAPIEVCLSRHAGHVQVTVSDGSSEPPRRLPYRAGVSDHGIGLRLVDQLSASWGWTLVPEGKDVWARVAVPAAPAT